MAKLYQSLLMALAFALIARIDLHAYAVTLQHRAAAPTRGHVRKLNALVRWAQQQPLRIHYPPTHCSQTLDIHSDGASRKEQDDGVDAGRALRGATAPRLGQSNAGAHLLPAPSRRTPRTFRGPIGSSTEGPSGSVHMVTRPISAHPSRVSRPPLFPVHVVGARA